MNRPIGVIDSGAGGLTVAKAIADRLPAERIVYIGDTARCPYGPRTASEVLSFTRQMAHKLQQLGIKMLVIACNTATAAALDELQRELPFPVIGVIEPGAAAAVKASSRMEIAVLATIGTVASGAYEAAIHRLHPASRVVAFACPAFVPLVESGSYETPFARDLVRETLQPLNQHPFDTVILGCTHYPLLLPFIQQAVGHRVRIVSSAEETALRVERALDAHGLRSAPSEAAPPVFYTTGSTPMFEAFVRRWLEIKSPDVRHLTLE